MAPEYLEPLQELEESLKQAQEAACMSEMCTHFYQRSTFTLLVVWTMRSFHAAGLKKEQWVSAIRGLTAPCSLIM